MGSLHNSFSYPSEVEEERWERSKMQGAAAAGVFVMVALSSVLLGRLACSRLKHFSMNTASSTFLSSSVIFAHTWLPGVRLKFAQAAQTFEKLFARVCGSQRGKFPPTTIGPLSTDKSFFLPLVQNFGAVPLLHYTNCGADLTTLFKVVSVHF